MAISSSNNELVHFGVKGMRWGVRKTYVDKVNKTTARLQRVSSGKGSTFDKVATVGWGGGLHGGVSNLDVIKGLGAPKKVMRSAINRNEAHVARINNGKLKARDVLRVAGTLSVLDIGAGAVKGYTTKK